MPPPEDLPSASPSGPPADRSAPSVPRGPHADRDPQEPEASSSPPFPAAEPVGRPFLGKTLAVFFTITATGGAFQVSCLLVVWQSDNVVAGVAVGSIAALITAGIMSRLFWVKTEPPIRG